MPVAKTYPASFKASVALEALQNPLELDSLAKRFSVAVEEIEQWMSTLKQRADTVFRGEDHVHANFLANRDLATTIAENSTQGLAMMNAEGFCVYANRAWLDMTGYAADEIGSKPLHDLVHHHYPDGRPFPMQECPIDRALPENFEVRAHHDVFYRKDGSTFEVMCAASPIFEAGKPVATVVEIRDITDQVQMERALREETRTLEILNVTGSTIASTLDLSELLQKVTDASTEICGAQFGAFFYNSTDSNGDAFLLYTLSGAPKEAFQDFGHPRATELFGPTFRGESPIRLDDVLQDSRYGKMPPHHGMPKGHLPVRSYLAVPVVFRDGEVLGGLFFGHSDPAMFTDKHERQVVAIAAQAAIAVDNARLYQSAQKSAEDRARLFESERKAKELAEQQNKAKDQFLAMLGHELRNPLHAIIAGAELMFHTNVSSESAHKALGIIQRQAEHLERLTDDLLDASRMLTGKLTLNKVVMRLDEAVLQCIESIKSSRIEENVSIEVTTEPLKIEADRARIDQIVTNLLNNAIKYSPPGSPIRVTLTAEGQEALLMISDRGMGISYELIDKIFEPFVQGPQELDRASGGIGMGLTIVKTLVELHQGQVKVESLGRNQGATFSIRLPLTAKTMGMPEPEAAYASSNDETVVVIEDNIDALKLLTNLLELSQFKVVTADSGLDGLIRIKNTQPSVAIIDIGLPDLNGYEIARKLREDPQTEHLPLIAVTGYGSLDDAAEAYEAGFDMHMTKPVNIKKLMHAISMVTKVVGRRASI